MPEIKKILIAEDEAINALTLRMYLSRRGYQITSTVSCGEDAIAESKINTPDLLIMDIRLAGAMDGIEAAKKIREDADIPVIFMTGYSEDTLNERTEELHPLGYLTKPMNYSDLEDIIKAYSLNGGE